MQAPVLFNPKANVVRVFLQGDFDPKQTMHLPIQHPTIAQYNQSAVLTLKNADAKLYKAKLKPLPQMNSWYVRIEND